MGFRCQRCYYYDNDEFTIDNQVLSFSIYCLSPDVGTGTASSDRAWYNVSESGTIEFRYGISDDDFDRATLQNVPGQVTSNRWTNSLAYGGIGAVVHFQKEHGTLDLPSSMILDSVVRKRSSLESTELDQR